jgi:hypothetical protein
MFEEAERGDRKTDDKKEWGKGIRMRNKQMKKEQENTGK